MPEYPKEIQKLNAALEETPENKKLRQMLARKYQDYGFFREGEREFRHLMKQGERDEELVLGLANCLQQMGESDEAERALDPLEKQGNPSAKLHIQLARVRRSLDRKTEAAQHYVDAIRMDPRLRDATLEEALLPFLREHQADSLEGVDTATDRDWAEELASFGKSLLAGLCKAERPRLDFSAVVGLAEAKRAIQMRLVNPLRKPEMYEAFGVQPKGVLALYGPGGCGKRTLAQATAGETGGLFVEADFSRWVDLEETPTKAVAELFRVARRGRPCLLYLETLEALAEDGGDAVELCEALAEQLDGLEEDGSGILVVGATEAPWDLDAELLAPGRFDRIQFVGPPDERARRGVLRNLLRGKPNANVDFADVADATAGLTLEELAKVVQQTQEAKLEESIQAGDLIPMTTKDLLRVAAKTRRASGRWFDTARLYAFHANDDGAYDELQEYLSAS